MKIAYLIHSLWNAGGTEKVLTLKANYLADKFGYQVTVITSFQQSRSPFFPLSDRIKRYDIGVNIEGRRNLLSYARLLKSFLKDNPQDLVVSLSGNELLVLPFLKDGSKKIGELHFSFKDLFSWYGDGLLDRSRTFVRKKELLWSASRLDSYVVLTKAEYSGLRNHIRHLYQIYNPLSFWPDHPSDLKSKRFIAVGRLIGEKNYSAMIQIWAKVIEKYPEWTLHIFGEGPFRSRLEKQIVDNNLQKSVLLRGHSSDIQGEMVNSSCILMTSTTEAFPMVLLEASACGLPVITYNCSPGISEIVADGVSGSVVPIGEIDAMTDKCLELIENPDKRKSFGEAARKRASAFGIDNVMSEWDSLFKHVLKTT